MSKTIDLAGQRFGRLMVLSRAENTKAGQAKWLCKCDCGETKVVSGYHLRSGRITSCGCYQKERASEYSKKYNGYRVDGKTVFVKMSNSDREMIVDSDVWESTKRFCWYENPHGYAETNVPIGARKSRRVMFHVMVFTDCPSGLYRDHINGNRLDNRRANIRYVTTQQNNHNHGKSKKNTSGYPGIRWEADRGKWLARIKFNDRTINLGKYSRIEDAVHARKEAEKKYFGEYRRKE